MPVITTLELDDLVPLRETRAPAGWRDIVASVPELHIRTFSMLGTTAQISFAIVTSSGFGMPKLVPFTAAACTAAMIFGCACPRIAGPHVPT